MAVRPVVRLFVACWNGIPGRVADQHRLADTTNIVYPSVGNWYPFEQPELCFYAMLTDGRGPHEFAIRQLYGVGPSERVVWQSRSVIVDLGDDPLAVQGFPIRIGRLGFPAPGQYEFVLLCDGSELHSFFIEARVSDDAATE